GEKRQGVCDRKHFGKSRKTRTCHAIRTHRYVIRRNVSRICKNEQSNGCDSIFAAIDEVQAKGNDHSMTVSFNENLRGKHFLKLADFSKEEIEYFIDLAIQLKKEHKAGVVHDY